MYLKRKTVLTKRKFVDNCHKHRNYECLIKVIGSTTKFDGW